MKECWKLIEDYPNYEVSNLGNVRNRVTGKIKKPSLSVGYHQVMLYKNNQYKFFKVHRLVANAFIPNPKNKRTVNHINGIKTDNYVSNLEWATDSENISHAYDTRLRFVTEKQGGAKKPIRCIETGEIFSSQASAARYFECDPTGIRQSIHKGCRCKGYRFELVQR